MAKSNTTLSTETKAKEGDSLKTVMALIDKTVKGAKSVVQSVAEFEKLLHDCTSQCLDHCFTFGDIRPADRLLKELHELKDRNMTMIAGEVMHWFKINSNIRWDKNGKCSLLKKGDKDWKEFTSEDVSAAHAEPFNETASAKRARGMSDAAHKRGLQDVTFDVFKGRVEGLTRWFKGVGVANKDGEVTNKFKSERDRQRISDGLTVLNAAMDAFVAGKLKPGSEAEEAPSAVNAAKRTRKAKEAPEADAERVAA